MLMMNSWTRKNINRVSHRFTESFDEDLANLFSNSSNTQKIEYY